MDSLIIFLLIGLAAGWLAGIIMRGSGHGLVVDLIIGCIGSSGVSDHLSVIFCSMWWGFMQLD